MSERLPDGLGVGSAARDAHRKREIRGEMSVERYWVREGRGEDWVARNTVVVLPMHWPPVLSEVEKVRVLVPEEDAAAGGGRFCWEDPIDDVVRGYCLLALAGSGRSANPLRRLLKEMLLHLSGESSLRR